MSDGPTDASCSKYDRVLLSLVYSTLSDSQYGHCKTAWKLGHVRQQDMNLILEGHHHPQTSIRASGLKKKKTGRHLKWNDVIAAVAYLL